MDWLNLLAVQGTVKSLLQHHSSKASILWRSAFFIVQLSHPYMTAGKTYYYTIEPMRGTSTECWGTYHKKEVRNATRVLIDTTISKHLYNKYQISKNTCDITIAREDG